VGKQGLRGEFLKEFEVCSLTSRACKSKFKAVTFKDPYISFRHLL
jgi:hypothetical protein